MRIVILAATLVLFAAPAVSQTLLLKGAAGQIVSITAAELAALPHIAVAVNEHGQPHAYEGVALSALMARVGVAADKPTRGAGLATVVRVTARDGYQVVLALAETDPATAKGRVIVADREAGRPLGDQQGPFRLVVEDDLRPARSARQVARIEVLDLATTAGAVAPHRP